MTSTIEQLRFPIGKFTAPKTISEFHIKEWISEIEALPEKLRRVISGLSETDLSKTYKPNGWTVKQVIHHLADSHMNSYIRFKLAVTEDNPTIRPYLEELWAECDEAKNADVEISLNLLEALHKRWVLFLRSMEVSEWDRTFYHPENKKTTALKEVVGIYAWHGNHHLSHVLLAIK